jgi:hypothetical protein
MTSSANPGPAGQPRHRPAPDPLTMTPGEKVMAEWEARHDVAARGSRATPGAIQHYLSESRSRERCDEAARPHPADRRASSARRPARPARPWWRPWQTED